ncbi:hypothetical protein MUP42_04005 [Candidatus Bathyarchaeota archaeon]|jgi:hypothetical protein|nr:hypothetical protein [Candidatus Bathyarchaeota archaeon]
MKKIRLMKKFMKNFVGKGINLVIKEKDGTFKVHTIEIMQKTDDTCPVKEVAIGDYFLRLVATNPQGREASIVCNWTDDLLENLITRYKDAKDANSSEITMFKDPQSINSNNWLITWSDRKQEEQEQKSDPIRYIT